MLGENFTNVLQLLSLVDVQVYENIPYLHPVFRLGSLGDFDMMDRRSRSGCLQRRPALSPRNLLHGCSMYISAELSAHTISTTF